MKGHLHKHNSRTAFLRRRRVRSPLPPHSKSMPFTEMLAIHLIIVFIKPHTAMRARKTSSVVFLPSIRLEILALDPAIALFAHTPIELVVVALAVRRVLEDVEFCGCEGRLTGRAAETLFMVAASQAAIGGFDGFPVDLRSAGAAFAFADWGEDLLDGRWWESIDVVLGLATGPRRRVGDVASRS